MASNPLKVVDTRRPKMSAQEAVDRGNALLAGQLAYKDGSFHRRDDVRWFLENGRPTIGWRR